MVDIAENNTAEINTAGARTTGPGRTSPSSPSSNHVIGGPPERQTTAIRYVSAGIRLSLGFIFLWAFLDKTFGLGHDTSSTKSWINGGSPTKGFLGSAAKGPLVSFYRAIAGNPLIDVLFMVALLGIGVALLLGVAMRLAAVAGAALTVLMWSAVLPPASNPFMDDHLVYAAVLILLMLLSAGNTLGLGRRWAQLPLVQRTPWLR